MLSFKQLTLLALIITCFFWWYYIDNQIMSITARSASAVWVFWYSNNTNNPFSKRLSYINIQYISLILTVVMLRKVMGFIGWYGFELSSIAWIVGWIASIVNNPGILQNNKVSFANHIVDTEAMITILSLLFGRLIQHYRFEQATALYMVTTAVMRLSAVVLHGLAYQNHQRLRSRPFFMVISVLFLSTLLWSIASFSVNKYTETTLAKAKVIEAKSILPNWFPPQLWPKLMTGSNS